jgi:hypothetical protein
VRKKKKEAEKETTFNDRKLRASQNDCSWLKKEVKYIKRKKNKNRSTRNTVYITHTIYDVFRYLAMKIMNPIRKVNQPGQ